MGNVWWLMFTTLILLLEISAGYSYDKGEVLQPTRCPGKYCGRTHLPTGNWSACGPCPRGFRTNLTSACVPCDDKPTFYDWLYLGFMALLSIIFHWYCIDLTAKRRSFTKEVLALHLCAFVESCSSAVLTLIIVEPVGSLHFRSCRVRKLSDWYTVFHNPNPNYEEVLHCAQEAVYPMYTMVFIYYALSLLLMAVIRPYWAVKLLPGRGKAAIFAALYFFPILMVIQAVFAGLIYYSYPYIVIILSVVSIAAHYAFQLDQSVLSLFVNSMTDVRNAVIVVGHWLLHAYGIVSITQLTDPLLHGALLALVPCPALFYILTARFTDPSKLHMD